jgi:predicted aspartyl protease
VLDTGAGTSCINTAFANELGLKLEGNMKGGASNSTVDFQFTTLPPFGLQGIEFNEQKAAVFDMTPLNKLLDIEADGILGFDFLSRFVTKVDFAHELLSFYDPKSFKYFGDGSKLDVHIKEGVFVAKATLDGVHSGTWLCDLGASSTSLEGAYASSSGIMKRKGVESLGRGAGESYLSRGVKCDSISFAGFSLKNPRIYFPIERIDTVSKADEIGNLGNTLFRNFVLYVDYANEQMIVEQGDQFGVDFPEDHSGLQLMRSDDGGYEVWYASKGTAAAKAGVMTGDHLVAINNIAVKNFDGLTAIRTLMSGKVGTKYNLVVRRGDKELDLSLTLEEMF